MIDSCTTDVSVDGHNFLKTDIRMNKKQRDTFLNCRSILKRINCPFATHVTGVRNRSIIGASRPTDAVVDKSPEGLPQPTEDLPYRALHIGGAIMYPELHHSRGQEPQRRSDRKQITGALREDHVIESPKVV